MEVPSLFMSLAVQIADGAPDLQTVQEGHHCLQPQGGEDVEVNPEPAEEGKLFRRPAIS